MLDGQIYGEPLVEGGRVVVATEDDTVYALSARTGSVLWAHHVATPVDRLETALRRHLAGGRHHLDACRRRDERRGVRRGRRGRGAGASHHLFGLSLSTGAVELNQPMDPPGSQPLNQLQRPGLALDDGEVIVGFGGNDGDCAFYHGWVAAVPELGGKPTTSRSIRRVVTTRVPSGWVAPPRWSTPKGNVWVAAGNGSVTQSARSPTTTATRCSSSAPSMHLEQFFAPSTWASDNASDLDLGSSSPALLDRRTRRAGR